MKKYYLKTYSLLSFFGVMALSSCVSHDMDVLPVEADRLECITADYAARSIDDDSDGLEEDFAEHDDNNDAIALLEDSFKVGDKLFFSQLSNSLVPFVEEEMPADAPEEMKERFGEITYPNLYTYTYQEKEYKPEWDEAPNGIGGYNFFPIPVTNSMEWDDVKYWGLNNNGFALFALYYPLDNQLNLNFKVEQNQYKLQNLQKSNFIGAYHSSSSAYTRLRFKLYHLMAYIKVTLYVPVYKDDDVDKEGNKIRTGFPADALINAEVMDVLTDFSINWYANRSSDTAPACSAISTGERSNVVMYQPPLESYSDGLPPKVTIKTAAFYASDDPLYDPEATDECWEITLSALIPAGQDYADTKQDWTNGNILRFNMRQNIGTVPKRYIFNGSNAMNLIGGGDPLTISQGNIQHLSLYLPRKGGAALLLGATVEDWKHASNDNMGLQQDPPLSGKDPENGSDTNPGGGSETNPDEGTGTNPGGGSETNLDEGT